MSNSIENGRVQSKMKEKMGHKRSPQEALVEADPIPHLQGILEIDDDNRDRGDGKTEGLRISQRETVRSRRMREREIGDEEDDARRDHAVQNTDDEDFGVEQGIARTRFVPGREARGERSRMRGSDRHTDGVASMHVQH